MDLKDPICVERDDPIHRAFRCTEVSLEEDGNVSQGNGPLKWCSGTDVRDLESVYTGHRYGIYRIERVGKCLCIHLWSDVYHSLVKG